MIRRFRDLLAPVSEKQFLDSFARKDRLVVKTTQHDRTASLLSWPTINHLLDTGIVPASRMQVLVLSKSIPESMYRSGKKLRLRTNALHQLAGQGVSIKIRKIEDYVPAIAVLADSMERRIGHRVAVNCYVTFGKDSAFEPHYDTHDVIAVQIHGAKRWRGYDVPITYPLPPDDGKISVAVGNPVWDERLEAGDILYVPRGAAHDAVGEVTPSIHLTFGIHGKTGIDVLKWLRKKARTEPLLRMDVTRAGGVELLRSHERKLKQRLKTLIDEASFDSFLDEGDRKRPTRARLSLGFDRRLPPDAWLSPAPRRWIPLPPASRGSVEVTVGGTKVGLSADLSSVFRTICEEDGLSFGELAEKLATTAEDKKLQGAVAELAAKGLLAIELR